MAKRTTTYVCQSCGGISPRWAGKCPACEGWNTLVEEAGGGATGTAHGIPKAQTKAKTLELETLSGSTEEAPRLPTGIAELDRVTGGGLVPGSALLIGGEPGIGKSTLLLQVSAALADKGRNAVYFSGEEASAQIRLRAQRLGLTQSPVKLAAETNLNNILATLGKGKTPDLVIIDSIQTLWTDGLDSSPGTVSQVRAATQSMIRYAKLSGAAVLLVGHVTKDGQIAGPKVVEHMVDTVLYFEGDRGQPYRILRTVKNRFGATDEIGVFEMGQTGLKEVANPSELFLGDRGGETPGAAVFASMEGTRPILVELQALVVPSALGTPRRAVVGWDGSRLAQLLAVLEARCGITLSHHDVYLNVAGGLRISEPAADAAAAAALVSSFSGVPLRPDSVYFGEVSLSGALRPAGHGPARLKEAGKLGFKRAVMPVGGEMETGASKIEIDRIASVRELVDRLK